MSALAREPAAGAGLAVSRRPSLILEALEAAGLVGKPAGLAERLAAIAPARVEDELSRPPAFSLGRLLALSSPAAAARLEDLARASQRLTRRRFGNAISLFAPLYLSNHCVNRCRYCGFNAGHPHRRRRLSLEEAMAEAAIIASEGFRDILLVSGEDVDHVNVDYLSRLAGWLLREGGFASVGMEVSIQSEDDYRRLFAAGIDGVTIFQETYDRESYAAWHPAGPKSVYANRLEASEAAARAGMRRLGLGALLGLEDWRFEIMALAVHADVLSRHYWRGRVSFSFPRIRPSESGHAGFPNLLSDAELTQMILALRLCFPDAGMTLSTRESPARRDNLIPLGITQISAGSKVNPGGYGGGGSTGQFEVSDERSAAEMAAALGRMGFDPVWKDWDAGFAFADARRR
jgi:2-iminoacetate synthase